MPFFTSSTQKPPIEPTSLSNLAYPELLILILITLLLFWQSTAAVYEYTLFLTTATLSFLLLLYTYLRQVNLYTSVFTVKLIAIVIGSLQFSPILSIGLASLLCSRLLITQRRARLPLFLFAILCTVFWYVISIKLRPYGLQLSLGLWLMALILLLSCAGVLWQLAKIQHQFTEQRKFAQESHERVTTMVSVISKLIRFLPPQLWQPITKSNAAISVNNKRAKLTVLFSDIAGFTELSDSLSADTLADILNQYMESMTIIANRHGAVLDKFIGDGLVCFFGDPNSEGNRQDAINCVAMAIDMRREMRTLRHQWRLLGFEGLYIRIGIATGYCHVGNFGSETRMNYTLIGREVNLAARLEGAAKKGDILISEATYDYVCHEYECVPTALQELKGFDEAVRAWQVLDPDVSQQQHSKWVDHDLPGFNLHLNFKDIRNYDYSLIRRHLSQALEQIEKQEQTDDDAEP